MEESEESEDLEELEELEDLEELEESEDLEELEELEELGHGIKKWHRRAAPASQQTSSIPEVLVYVLHDPRFFPVCQFCRFFHYLPVLR